MTASKINITSTLLFLALFSIAGCQQLPGKSEVADADYGQYPEDYELTVKAYYHTLHSKEQREQIKFNAIHKPIRYFLANKLGEAHYGYLVCVTVSTPRFLASDNTFRYDALLLRNRSVEKYIKGGDWWGEPLCPNENH